MTELIVSKTGSLTMSSLEISELVGSRHDKVKQSIERLAERGVISLPPMGEVSNDGPGPKAISVYNLCKRDSLIVVAQLCPEFTAKIVDRWQALEEQAAKPMFVLPQSFPEALRALAESEEKKAHVLAQLAIAAPKAEALDRISSAEGSVCLSAAAKMLGIPQKQFFVEMSERNWIFKRGGIGPWLGYSDKSPRYLDHRPVTHKNSAGDEVITPQCVVTAEGLAKLAVLFSVETRKAA
jgi:phage regulator Rha-like protein